ncbi:hypothetical protein OMW55_06090 [Sphingomonas sp. BN140010]|uniref:Uncharacterized protein n=1 Tax=Sphingomonas arvum TaxID=2992113 RepID=A0ABT3JE83_9SPHN|nr:hypothetical protein [Sphingomonas sp. BN140010]MCW3797375.1 hypothetical protein [Sphingomonas sp. BN140010]
MPDLSVGARYYTIDDPEHGVTHTELGAMPPDEQREYMLSWFRGMFEDPANETPYQSSEGGYLYIWGGPYDAREEIEGQFHDVVSQETMEDVIDELERSGITEWAPGPKHPDHVRAAEDYDAAMEEPPPQFEEAVRQLEAGNVPAFGAAVEVELRGALHKSANDLLSLVNSQEPVHGGMGHNKPPLDEHEYELALIVGEVRAAATIIAAGTASETPDALEIAKASGRLAKLIGWTGSKLDAAANEFAKSFGKAAGNAAGVAFGALLLAGIAHLLGLSWDWLMAILPGL